MWTGVTTVTWLDIIACIHAIVMWLAAPIEVEWTARRTWFGARVSTSFDPQRLMEARAFARRIESILGHGEAPVIAVDVVPPRARAPPASPCTNSTTTTNETRWRRHVERTHDG
jgi:hypothetical protein